MRLRVALPLLALLGGMVSGAVSPLEATVLRPLTERQLVKDAELVFQGRVSRIDYRLSSAPTTGEARMPHTFVTFRIEKILKGSVSTSTGSVTLRFLGGPDARKRFLTVEGCPLFDVGDRDILFVGRNQRHACPVAGWTQGRYRVIGADELYSDGGREVWLTPKPALRLGPRHLLPEVVTHWRTPSLFTRIVHDDGVAEAPSLPTAPIQGRRLTASALRSFLAGLVNALHTPAELAGLPPVRSADPAVPFFFGQPGAVPSEPDATTAAAGSPGR